MFRDFFPGSLFGEFSTLEKRQTCSDGYQPCAGAENGCFNATAEICCSNSFVCPSDTYCLTEINSCCPLRSTPEECGLTSSSSSSSSPPATRTTPLSTRRQTATSTATRTSSADNSGLSTGAKAGVGVGVGIGALIMIALLLAILFWRRKKRRDAKNRESGAAYVDGKAELAADQDPKRTGVVEELGDGSEVYEKGGVGRPAEMENGARYELPGEWHGHEAQAG